MSSWTTAKLQWLMNKLLLEVMALQTRSFGIMRGHQRATKEKAIMNRGNRIITIVWDDKVICPLRYTIMNSILWSHFPYNTESTKRRGRRRKDIPTSMMADWPLWPSWRTLREFLDCLLTTKSHHRNFQPESSMLNCKLNRLHCRFCVL